MYAVEVMYLVITCVYFGSTSAIHRGPEDRPRVFLERFKAVRDDARHNGAPQSPWNNRMRLFSMRDETAR